MRANEFINEDPDSIKIDSLTKAKEWVYKIYNQFPTNPIDPRQRAIVWGEGDNQQFAMFELAPSMSKKDAVEIAWFQAYPRRQGVGSRAMKMLQDLAAKDGISLTLFPWDKGQVSRPALINFYKNSGFIPIKKGSNVLQWEPR